MYFFRTGFHTIQSSRTYKSFVRGWGISLPFNFFKISRYSSPQSGADRPIPVDTLLIMGSQVLTVSQSQSFNVTKFLSFPILFRVLAWFVQVIAGHVMSGPRLGCNSIVLFNFTSSTTRMWRCPWSWSLSHQTIWRGHFLGVTCFSATSATRDLVFLCYS